MKYGCNSFVGTVIQVMESMQQQLDRRVRHIFETAISDSNNRNIVPLSSGENYEDIWNSMKGLTPSIWRNHFRF